MSFSYDWKDNVIHREELEQGHGIKLEPCPFCGSRNLALWLGPRLYIMCGHCGAEGPQAHYTRGYDQETLAHSYALRVWNIRNKI